MKAVVFSVGDDLRMLGRLDGDVIVEAGESPATGFVPTAEAWSALAEASGETHALSAVRLHAPVRPGKILAIGLNYRDHAEESELDVPPVPVVFGKFPSSINDPGAAIVIPREETRPDFEGELAVVIGRRTYRATLENALDSVGAVTVLHDVSGRRAQLETPLRQFTMGKSFDTFTPIGPCLVDASSVDVANLHVTTVVSGETMQNSNTSNLIFPVSYLIEYLSRGTTLEPGDIIATGTPGGVGDSRVPPRYLRDGDVVEITISGIGTLSNPVVFEA
jgi:2-keto-4-pentenoate hydratase/2-oxohepta-3-ene-1,7-dioic acid hydratase in catechol pathway